MTVEAASKLGATPRLALRTRRRASGLYCGEQSVAAVFGGTATAQLINANGGIGVESKKGALFSHTTTVGAVPIDETGYRTD